MNLHRWLFFNRAAPVFDKRKRISIPDFTQTVQGYSGFIVMIFFWSCGVCVLGWWEGCGVCGTGGGR